MRLPWFMHMHGGVNTSVGVLPTPVGAVMRSYGDGSMEAAWYPMDHGFPGGDSRQTVRIVKVEADDDGERALEDAVVDFMHAHPVLAVHTAWDDRRAPRLDWEFRGSGALGMHETPEGLFFRVHHGDQVTLEHLPAGGAGKRETLGVYADSCGEETLAARIDARVWRRLAKSRGLDGAA